MATSMGPTRSVTSSTAGNIPTNYGALGTLVTVFFFWGFIAAGNSVFIPFCRHYFHLDQFQSQLVDFAFYTAYYIGALVLFMYGAFGGKDLVAKWGYKRSIVYGLLFSAIGAAAMIIAVRGSLDAKKASPINTSGTIAMTMIVCAITIFTVTNASRSAANTITARVNNIFLVLRTSIASTSF